MNLKKIAGTVTLTDALGAAALGSGRWFEEATTALRGRAVPPSMTCNST